MVGLLDGICTMNFIVLLVSLWFIVVKMGQPGWKGIIPCYNMWAVAKQTKSPVFWFWGMAAGLLVILLSVAAVSGAITAAGQSLAEGALILWGTVCLAGVLVALVFQALIFHGLSKCFGRGGGFTAGLMLLPFVFFPVLAFGGGAFTEPENPKSPTVPTAGTEESPDEHPATEPKKIGDNEPEENGNGF